MTIATNDTYERYTVSGVGPYAFSFKVFASTDLTVTTLESGDVDPATLSTSLYTVSGVGDDDGGSITLTSGAATTYAGYTLDIRSNVPRTQPTSIKNQGSFAPLVHETAFDRLGRQIQDLYRQVRQAFRYPDDVDLDGKMTNRTSWLSKYLYVNSSGVIEPATSIGSTALTQLVIGETLFPRTAAEIATGVTPVNYGYRPGRLARWCAANGSTDDTAAFQDALDTGLPLTDDGQGLYRITSALVAPAAGVLQMYGKIRLRPEGNIVVLNNAVTTVATTTLSASAREGARTISVTSATGIAAGQVLKLTSTRDWNYNHESSTVKRGEVNQVRSISGTTITLALPLNCEYDIGSETVTVVAITAKKVDIDGLEVIWNTPALGQMGFTCANSSVRNLRVSGAQAAGLSVVDCFGLQIQNPIIDETYYTGLGYGIQVNSSTATHIVGGNFNNVRHGVDFSGGIPCHLGSVTGATIIGNSAEGSCLGSHGGANRLRFSANTLINGKVGVTIRSPNTAVDGNYYFGCDTFVVLSGAGGLSVKGNTHMRASVPKVIAASVSESSYFLDIASTYGASNDVYLVPSSWIIVEDNNVSIDASFINVNSNVTELKRLRVRGNHIVANGSSNKFIDGGAATTMEAATCELTPNTFQATNSAMVMFGNLTQKAPEAFGVNDATPSVYTGSKTYVTANSVATTITAFDDAITDQEIVVIIGDANTTIDFTGTTLKGNAGADWTPGNGDFMRCRFNGTNWYCDVTDATA